MFIFTTTLFNCSKQYGNSRYFDQLTWLLILGLWPTVSLWSRPFPLQNLRQRKTDNVIIKGNSIILKFFFFHHLLLIWTCDVILQILVIGIIVRLYRQVSHTNIQCTWHKLYKALPNSIIFYLIYLFGVPLPTPAERRCHMESQWHLRIVTSDVLSGSKKLIYCHPLTMHVHLFLYITFHEANFYQYVLATIVVFAYEYFLLLRTFSLNK